jgi:hypothetical protein
MDEAIDKRSVCGGGGRISSGVSDGWMRLFVGWVGDQGRPNRSMPCPGSYQAVLQLTNHCVD